MNRLNTRLLVAGGLLICIGFEVMEHQTEPHTHVEATAVPTQQQTVLVSGSMHR